MTFFQEMGGPVCSEQPWLGKKSVDKMVELGAESFTTAEPG